MWKKFYPLFSLLFWRALDSFSSSEWKPNFLCSCLSLWSGPLYFNNKNLSISTEGSRINKWIACWWKNNVEFQGWDGEKENVWLITPWALFSNRACRYRNQVTSYRGTESHLLTVTLSFAFAQWDSLANGPWHGHGQGHWCRQQCISLEESLI